jgi:hypothetical protein
MMKQLLNWFKGLSAPKVNLDAFASGQVGSKLWMISELETCLNSFKDTPKKGYRIWILAGWYGVTNLLLRARSIIPVDHVYSIDLDPTCQTIADKVNKFWEWQAWQFKAHTADANGLVYTKDNCPHIVINSSVEHFESRVWFDRIPKGTLVVLQACDLAHDTHVSEYKSKDDLLNAYQLSEVLYDGTMVFAYPNGDMQRFMVIGIK